MTDPAAPPPAAPPPASPPATPPATPPAVSRPEWLPEAHWDQAAATIKPEFGQHYAEVSTFYQTETEKRNALAARKPEDIKFEVKLPEAVKVPEGMDLKINESDPRIPVLRELALKNNWTQDQVDALVTLDAQQQIAAHAAEQTRIAAERSKLGPNVALRETAAKDWLKGMKDRGELTAEEYAVGNDYTIDAAGLTFLEKMIAKTNGSVPGHNPGNPPPPAQVPQAERWYGATTPKKVS
jgi:hypothetical protein